MKATYALVVGLASTVLAGPIANLVKRDASADLAALTSVVEVHTGNINHTLATLPAANTVSLGNSSVSNSSTANANITAEFNLIAKTLNSTSNTFTKRSFPLFTRQAAAVACNATCQIATYNDLGALTAEIAYTMEGCINKNAVDLTSASSVLITVVKALGVVTTDLENSVGASSGIVVTTLQQAMGTEIGGALATFISPP